MPAVTVHLVRHAEHGLLGRVLAGRTPDVPLSPVGRRQAGTLAAHFAVGLVRAVLTSPVQRARETAAPVAAAAGLLPVVEPGLDEVDFGAWAGLGFDALADVPGWAAWNGARGLAHTPGGETMLAVQARAVAALMGQRALGGSVAAVSHSDVIKAVLAYALGMPLDLLHRLDIAPASRSVLVLGDDFARVEAINLPP